MDEGTVGELRFRIDAAAGRELDRTGGGHVANDKVAGGLVHVDALPRDSLVELPDRRARQRQLQRVLVCRRAGRLRRGLSDAAGLRDQRQIENVAGDRHLTGDAFENIADRVELDVSAADGLHAGGLGRRDRSEGRIGNAAEQQVGSAAEIDLRLRLRRYRTERADDDQALLRDARGIAHDSAHRIRRRRDGQLPRTGRGQKPFLRSGQRRSVDAGEGEGLRGCQAPDRAAGRIKHDLPAADVERQPRNRRRWHAVGGIGGSADGVGELILGPLRAGIYLRIERRTARQHVAEAGIVAGERGGERGG